MSETPKSILDGVDSLINSHFFAGCCRRRKAVEIWRRKLAAIEM